MLRVLAGLLLAAALLCLSAAAQQPKPAPPKPAAAQPAPAKPAPTGSPNVKVWVNTKSGVYHCPGTPSYGKTKNGAYMMQKDALAKRYRPAHRKDCR